MLNYPLDLRFKTIAIARQISVEDATGRLIWYVKMKSFKLKEAVTVFGDREQTRPLFQIAADRMIDVGATYSITDATTRAPVGSLRNQGMRSLWRANYEVVRSDGRTAFRIREENPWIKVLDALLNDVPILGLFSGYMLHPRYLAVRDDGSRGTAVPDGGDAGGVIRMRKEAAFLEGRYSIERLAMVPEEDERLLLLGALMMVLLEKRRG